MLSSPEVCKKEAGMTISTAPQGSLLEITSSPSPIVKAVIPINPYAEPFYQPVRKPLHRP